MSQRARAAAPLLGATWFSLVAAQAPAEEVGGLPKDWREAEEAADRVRAERAKTIAAWLVVVHSPFDKTTGLPEDWTNQSTKRNVAIALLGDIRAEEAAQPLVRWLIPQEGQLPYVYQGPLTRHEPPYGSIAQDALVKIGKPVTRLLIAELERTSDLDVRTQRDRSGGLDMRMACCSTLEKVEGLEIARRLISQRISALGSGNERDNLQAALSLLGQERPGPSSAQEFSPASPIPMPMAQPPSFPSTPKPSGWSTKILMTVAFVSLLLGFALAALLRRRRR